jgi:peptidoglycan/xylan/chitin deacetylase (PgdA/CDA1 family)
MLRPKIVVLFLARLFGLFAVARLLTRSHVRILCYHAGSVGDESSFNPKLFVTPHTFRTRMRWLKAHSFHFVSLDDAVENLGKASARSAGLRTVITFDDGWASTGKQLVPILAEMNIPSTLYLASKQFLEGAPIVNVVVRYLVWKADTRVVRISGFHAGVDGEHDLRDTKVRAQLVRSAVDAIENVATGRSQVCAELERLARCLDVPVSELRLDTHRFDYLSPTELAALPSSLCHVELHGHAHRYPRGEPDRFREELTLCWNTITGLGLRAPRHYCYPSGIFDAAASPLLSEFGVISATTCVPGLVMHEPQPARHYLPRFLDGEDVHPLEFEAELSGFAQLVRRYIKRKNNDVAVT